MRWIKKLGGGTAVFAACMLGACSGTDQVVGINEAAVAGGGAGGAGSAGPGIGGASAGSAPAPASSGDAGPAGPAPAALGAPCLSDDEYSPNFSGFAAQEVNVDNQAPGCASQICLKNHFQGRMSCPYGQPAAGTDCLVAGSTQLHVTTAVPPQLTARQSNVASICSCHCAGSGPGPYCTCPDSMQCEHLIDDLAGAPSDLSGSYCIPNGSQYDRSQLSSVCVAPNCGAAHPY